MWEVKINEAVLFKVKKRCLLGRLQLSHCKLCVRISSYHAGGKCGRHSLLPSPWKPHLFHRQRGGRAILFETGVWIIPHYLALTLLLTYYWPLIITSWRKQRTMAWFYDSCSSSQIVEDLACGTWCKHLQVKVVSGTLMSVSFLNNDGGF